MSDADLPEVSVVLAVQDDPQGLEIAAESILAQRDVSLELIVVDDGSAEATRVGLAELASSDGRVRPFYAERSGLTAALALGCEHARAPAVARHDAGDVSDPRRLRLQLDLLQASERVAFISCWTRCVGPGGEDLQLVTGHRADATPVRLDPVAAPRSETVGPSSHGSVLFRRETYQRAGGYRVCFRLAQDWDLWWRLSEQGDFAAIPESLYTRVLSPSSLSFRFGELQRQFGNLAREAAVRRRQGEEEGEQLRRAEELAVRLAGAGGGRRSAARGYYFIGSLLRARGDSRARPYFVEALRRNPLLLRAWASLALSYR